MVATTSSYNPSRHRAGPGEGFDGVVRVSFGTLYATGALLFDGRAVLTAAHLFNEPGATARVTFETTAGTRTVDASAVLRHPAVDDQGNHDLALAWLGTPAPLQATRYGLYRQTDELGRSFTMVGYGQAGAGDTGARPIAEGSPLRLRAENRFDADAAALKSVLGSIMGWTPVSGAQLLADFDNGRGDQDALGRLMALSDLGLGDAEGLIAQGDSGGPAFVDGRIAGVASYTTRLSQDAVQPDIDATSNSSFGEIASWQRVSRYQQWIDQSLRAAYPDAPTRPEEVRRSVAEGQDGTSYVYFLVQYLGERQPASVNVSVEYATRDGTAVAGSDYVAVSGTLVLYPTETHAVVAVEVIGDRSPEPDEQFYLDVFSPVGGRFANDVVRLTAVRTLVDDDGWIG